MNEEEKLRLTEIKVMPTKRDGQNVASRMTSSLIVTRYRIGDDHVRHDEKMLKAVTTSMDGSALSRQVGGG